jgi:proteasome lid subunit RPN8/RPN11
MVSRLTLSSNNLNHLVSLSKEALPMECCALLLGETKVRNLIEVIVTDAISVRNEDRSSASFSIEPEELLNAYRLAEAKKLQVVGIFHSHPSYPVPSSTDQRYMKINPVAWLIYSTTTEEFGAFIFEDSIRQVELQVMV